MARGRHGARRLLVQALYQRQLGGHTAAELIAQFSARKEFRGIDAGYFRALIEEITRPSRSLDELISSAADRPVAQLDPVERGVLWIGLTELRAPSRRAEQGRHRRGRRAGQGIRRPGQLPLHQCGAGRHDAPAAPGERALRRRDGRLPGQVRAWRSDPASTKRR